MDGLQIVNGDLVISNGAYATISGPARVQQDVMIAALTPLGTNKFHVRYGSIFDNYIGLPGTLTIQSLVRAEFNRIISNYMSVQLSQVQKYSQAGQKSPFLQSELILSIGNITVTQNGTVFLVKGSVNTSSGAAVNVTNTITGS